MRPRRRDWTQRDDALPRGTTPYTGEARNIVRRTNAVSEIVHEGRSAAHRVWYSGDSRLACGCWFTAVGIMDLLSAP